MEQTNQDHLYIRNKTDPDNNKHQNTRSSVWISGNKIKSLKLMVTFSKPCSILQGI
jgi:hypothetical protein